MSPMSFGEFMELVLYPTSRWTSLSLFTRDSSTVTGMVTAKAPLTSTETMPRQHTMASESEDRLPPYRTFSSRWSRLDRRGTRPRPTWSRAPASTSPRVKSDLVSALLIQSVSWSWCLEPGLAGSSYAMVWRYASKMFLPSGCIYFKRIVLTMLSVQFLSPLITLAGHFCLNCINQGLLRMWWKQ